MQMQIFLLVDMLVVFVEVLQQEYVVVVEVWVDVGIVYCIVDYEIVEVCMWNEVEFVQQGIFFRKQQIYVLYEYCL